MNFLLSILLCYFLTINPAIDTHLDARRAFILYDGFMTVGNISIVGGKTMVMMVPTEKGAILIYFNTGEVNLINCSPKEASLDFWKEIAIAFPIVKDTIADVGIQERDKWRKHDLKYGEPISILNMQNLIGKQKDGILIDINGLPYRIKH